MKTVFHVIGNGRNFGDLALQWTVQNGIARQIEEPVQWVPIDLKQPTPIHGDLIDLINRTGDALVVGGGGMVMCGDGFKTRSGWQFNIGLEELDRLDVPLIIYGIGYNVFPYNDPPPDDLTQNHLRATYKKASAFSVRDRGTKKTLAKFGIGGPIDVIPDPAMFTPGLVPDLPGIKIGERVMALNWAGDRSARRFLNVEETDAIEIVGRTLQEFSKQQGYDRIIYVPHVQKYDCGWAAKQFKYILGDRFYNLAEHCPWMYPEQYVNVPFLAGVYSRCDVALGMRGHANIIPYGQGCSIVPYGDHPKQMFFANEVGVQAVSSDGRNLFEALLSNSSSEQTKRQRQDLRKFEKTLYDWNEKVARVITG